MELTSTAVLVQVNGSRLHYIWLLGSLPKLLCPKGGFQFCGSQCLYYCFTYSWNLWSKSCDTWKILPRIYLLKCSTMFIYIRFCGLMSPVFKEPLIILLIKYGSAFQTHIRLDKISAQNNRNLFSLQIWNSDIPFIPDYTSYDQLVLVTVINSTALEIINQITDSHYLFLIISWWMVWRSIGFVMNGGECDEWCGLWWIVAEGDE